MDALTICVTRHPTNPLVPVYDVGEYAIPQTLSSKNAGGEAGKSLENPYTKGVFDISDIAHLSNEWRAALHILDSPILRSKSVRQYVDDRRQEIHFDQLWQDAAPWSDGERLLIQIAWDLFDGGGEAPLGEIIRRLDDNNLRLVYEAIDIWRGTHSATG